MPKIAALNPKWAQWSQVAFGVLFLRGEAGATGEATSQTLLEELGKHEAHSVSAEGALLEHHHPWTLRLWGRASGAVSTRVPSPPSSPTQQPQLQFQSRQERCRFLLFIIFMWKGISSTSTFLKFLPNLSGVIDVNNSAWSSLPVHRQEIETVTVLFAYSLFHLDSTQCSTLPKAAVF